MMRTSFCRLLPILAFVSLAAAGGSAQTAPPSVKALVAEGFQIVAISPIIGSYAVFLSKGAEMMICQIGFDAARNAFATEKCFALAQ